MHRIFYLFFFSVLSVFLMNTSTHAIGGKGTEEVPDQTIKSKGILKIQRKDGGIGTAVLFKEGNGWLGLSARHVFDKFSLKSNPIVAYLGEERRDIVKVYYPSNKTDLVLFVLNNPLKDVDGFPCLPEIVTTTSTYAGYIYGYGRTTASNNHAPIANSSGMCRTGHVIAADFHHLEEESQQFLNIDKAGLITDFSLNNIMFSFSLFQNSEVLDNNTGYEKAYRFNQSLLENRCLPIKNRNPLSNQLISSSCFTSYGDSGGPLISDDNQLYAICHRGNFVFQGGMYFDLSENLQRGNHFTGFEIKFEGEKLQIGFYKEDNSKLYIGFPS